MKNISKSGFIRGLQCMKSLYLHYYNPDLRDETSESQQHLFDTGHNVGFLAQQLFPGGIDASHGERGNYGEAISRTLSLIQDIQEVIYEAAFSYRGSLCYLDILVLEEGGWVAYEVKSSTDVKDYHIMDAAFQYYVITGSGLPLKKIFLVHVNNQYVRKGDLDLNEFFTIVPLTEDVLALQPEISVRFKAMQSMLEAVKEPEIPIGPYCTKPFACDFMGHCWREVPEYSVFNISGLGVKAFDLYEKGIIEVKDVLDDFPLSVNQRMQVIAEQRGEIFRNNEELATFKAGLVYPLYFLDFETIMPAVPFYDNCRPYQQITFQYSLDKKSTPGTGGSIEHFEFLGTPPADPRPDLIRTLVDQLGTNGTIITWNVSFERSRLNEIAIGFPEFRTKIEAITERLVDLMVPFRKKLWYMPEMKGSYSIKKVLPALESELSYGNLEIQEGGTASLIYESLYTDPDPESIRKKRADLLTYCGLDTMSMVRILEKL